MTQEATLAQIDGSDRSYAPTSELAASWYIALESRALAKKPVAVTLFGQELVAWRAGDGTPVLMERYCAHLGASLANGEVVDGCIRCPFHGWRYDGDGSCVHIPADRAELPCLDVIPPAAKQRTYPTAEAYGYVWAWYGSEAPLHRLPPFPGMEEAMCIRFAYPTTTSVLRVVENFYDAQHANPVHGLPIRAFKLKLLSEDPGRDDLRALARDDAWFGAAIDFQVDRYFGAVGAVARLLGRQMDEMNLRFDGYPGGCVMTVSLDGDLKYRLLQAVTPVRQGMTVMHMLIAIRREGTKIRQLADYVLYGMQTKIAAGYDVAIWNGMKADGGGAYSRYDRLVLKYRGFYREWVARAERERVRGARTGGSARTLHVR